MNMSDPFDTIDHTAYEKLLAILPEELDTQYPYTIKDNIQFTQNELRLHYIQNYNTRFFNKHSKGKQGGNLPKPSNVILYLY